MRETFLPTCREMSRHSSRSLDGPLPFFQRFGIGLHLVFCRLCRRYKRQIRWLSAAAGRPAAGGPVASHLSDSGRDRLKQSLRRQFSPVAIPASDPANPSQPHEHGHDHHC